MDSTGIKYDQEKSRVDLIDADFLEGLGNVLKFGASKYGDHNWRGGIRISRLLGSTLRHALAISRREDIDNESNLHHCFHLACNAMFLYCTLRDRPDLDDRYRKNEPIST